MSGYDVKRSMASSQIVEKVRRKLLKRHDDWAEIAKSTGVSYSWLYRFSNRLIIEPGFTSLASVALTVGITVIGIQGED